MNPITVLLASVTRIENAADAAEAFGLGLAAQLKAWANEPAAILAIAAELDAKATAVGNAIVANTPAAPASSVSEAANALATTIEQDPTHPANAGAVDPDDGKPDFAEPVEPVEPEEVTPVSDDATPPADGTPAIVDPAAPVVVPQPVGSDPTQSAGAAAPSPTPVAPVPVNPTPAQQPQPNPPVPSSPTPVDPATPIPVAPAAPAV